MMFRRFLIQIFCLLVVDQLRSQQYYFQNYSAENGLPFVQVSCMFQDNNGYLWAGGYGGLTRFDGKEFRNFGTKHGLIDHNITAIGQDTSGAIYVGTGKGLSIIHKGKSTSFSVNNGFTDKSVTSFSKGFHQEMYIGTQAGLYRYAEGKISRVDTLKDVQVNCLFKQDSVLLIGTNKGLLFFGHGRSEFLQRKDGLPDDHVNCLSIWKGQIAIGTSGGLCFLDPSSGKLTNYYVSNGLIDENITSILNQSNTYLWLGSQTGLMRFDGKQFQYCNIGLENNSNVIRCLLNDREDNVWIGTHSGLFKFRDESFTTFDKITGPGNAFIYSIFRDRNADLWICSENNGVYRMRAGFFKRYGIQDGLGTNVCRGGIELKNGKIIFATKDGIAEWIGEKFRKIDLPSQMNGPFDMLYEDRSSALWISGTSCIAKMEWHNGKPHTEVYELPIKGNYQVYGFCEDEHGKLFVGAFPGGLFEFKENEFEQLNEQYSLSNEALITLKYVKGKIFAATLNGLLILDLKTRSKRYITEQEGLNSNLVYSIEFSENRNTLWVGTNQGINRFDLKSFFENDKVVIRSFGKQQGFSGVECNVNGIWEDSDGAVWFGTVSGLVKHEPGRIKKNTVNNKTLIHNIKLFYDDTLLSTGVKLPSKFNTITFYYRGICLTNPEKVEYVKKLEPLEKEWSLPSGEDYSKYVNLAPGTYTFLLKSRNNEGVWDLKPVKFTFTILQPFYTRWWFILLCVVLLFVLVFIAVQLRIRKIKRQQRQEFDRKVEISRIELKALRSQMNPHFVFNSLNSIQHYIYNSKGEEAIHYLSKFARLVRIILNNSNKPTVTIAEDIEALKLYLELERMRFEDKFDYEVIVDASVDLDYDIMPPMLTQPYVENAILHGLNPKPGKGKLSITFKADENFLTCTISDNGIGRQKAAEIKRTMPVSKHKSMGMQITEDRLRILNEVSVSQYSVDITDLKDEKGHGTGTMVELHIPLNG